MFVIKINVSNITKNNISLKIKNDGTQVELD